MDTLFSILSSMIKDLVTDCSSLVSAWDDGPCPNSEAEYGAELPPVDPGEETLRRSSEPMTSML